MLFPTILLLPLLLLSHAPTPTSAVQPSTANCTTNYINQPVDHFSFSTVTDAETYSERYYVYDTFFKPNTAAPIFFYCGNEGDVGLYVNNTGLMWQNAQAFGAMLVFAEHRDYGNSTITKPSVTKPSVAKPSVTKPSVADAPLHLSHELALADYAVLIATLRTQYNAHDSPVIAFGGSYGGKLAAWLRMKYPASVQGNLKPLTLPFVQHRHLKTYWFHISRCHLCFSSAVGLPW